MTEGLFDFNRHGALKAPPSLWLCSAFLLRYWVLVVILVSSWVAQSSENVSWVYGLLSWPMLLAESPMLLLVCAGVRRVPDGGLMARLLWRRGREILSLTAALSLCWAVWFLASRQIWDPLPERLIVAMASVEATILVSVWRSALFRSVFEDFPGPTPSPPRAS